MLTISNKLETQKNSNIMIEAASEEENLESKRFDFKL